MIPRMNGYAQVSQPIKPQRRVDQSRASNPERFRKQAEFLATINLSHSDTWSYELKTLPRVKGRSTNVIITEYDLPRPTIEPHDVIVVDGDVWYTNFGEQFLGKLDPKTGKHTEFAMTAVPAGLPGRQSRSQRRQGRNLWVGMMYQGAVAKFDRKTESFQYWQIPPERHQGRLPAQHGDQPDGGRRQAVGQRCRPLDPVPARPRHRQVRGDGSAQRAARRQGKATRSMTCARTPRTTHIVTDFQKNHVIKIDAKTLKFTVYQTGTQVSRNRRGRIDEQDRFWFAQYRGNKITMFDTKEERMQEFALPTRHTHPYDVIWDKNGELWTGGMTTDRVVRLDPKTGESVEYQLPRNTNMRRMFVDNTTARPTFWVGSNHGASIVRVEPQD